MVSIQERFLIKSGLWWRAYGKQKYWVLILSNSTGNYFDLKIDLLAWKIEINQYYKNFTCINCLLSFSDQIWLFHGCYSFFYEIFSIKLHSYKIIPGWLSKENFSQENWKMRIAELELHNGFNVFLKLQFNSYAHQLFPEIFHLI